MGTGKILGLPVVKDRPEKHVRAAGAGGIIGIGQSGRSG